MIAIFDYKSNLSLQAIIVWFIMVLFGKSLIMQDACRFMSLTSLGNTTSNIVDLTQVPIPWESFYFQSHRLTCAAPFSEPHSYILTADMLRNLSHENGSWIKSTNTATREETKELLLCTLFNKSLFENCSQSRLVGSTWRHISHIPLWMANVRPS